MKLYLVCHAIAVERGTPEGMEQARRTAKGLKKLRPEADALFSSPYARAMQTAEQIARVYGARMPVRELPELRPDTPPAETSKILKTMEGGGHLFFVGHEPHLSSWIGRLIGERGGARCLLKKGGAACVEVEELDQTPLKGVLRWLMTPKHLDRVGA